MSPRLHKYMERGAGGFANLTLPSGERLLLSLAASGIRVHRLHLAGLIPGKVLYVADAVALSRIVVVIGRDLDRYPELPDDAAMQALLVGATTALTDVAAAAAGPMEGDLPLTRLSVVTRAALGQADSKALVRLYTRAANTV